MWRDSSKNASARAGVTPMLCSFGQGGQGQGGPDEDAGAKATRPPLTSWSALPIFVNQPVRLLHGWDWPSHEFQELEIPDDRN